MKYGVLSIILLFILSACSEDKLKLFDGPASLYFDQQSALGARLDTVAFSFGLTSVNDTVFRIRVKGTGEVVDYDRSFRVEVERSENAREGVNYELPDEFVFRANRSYDYLPVTLFRGGEDDDTTRFISFRLLPNDHFEVGKLPYILHGTNQKDTLDATRITLRFTSYMDKPLSWNESWLGYFSITKFILINDLCGISAQDWIDWGYAPPIGNMHAWIGMLENYLLMKLAEGPEAAIKDPKGTKGYMTMRGRIQHGEEYNPIVIPDNWPVWPDEFPQ